MLRRVYGMAVLLEQRRLHSVGSGGWVLSREVVICVAHLLRCGILKALSCGVVIALNRDVVTALWSIRRKVCLGVCEVGGGGSMQKLRLLTCGCTVTVGGTYGLLACSVCPQHRCCDAIAAIMLLTSVEVEPGWSRKHASHSNYSCVKPGHMEF